MQVLKTVTVQELDLSNEEPCRSAWACYQAGFAGEPWNEWKKCPTCEASYGLPVGNQEQCPRCGGHLAYYWPIEQIAKDVRASLALPASYCAVALVEGKVVGLVLGYGLSAQALSEQLGLEIGITAETVAYQDELVVHPDWQGHGIGRLLYDSWMAWVKRSGMRQVVARTLSQPPSVVYLWYQDLGYKVTACYPPYDERVILSLRI